MKVLKHFIYLYIGCWMQSAGLCSLNHDTTTSIGSTLPQLYKNKFPTSAHPHGYNSLSKVAPIHPSTAYQGAKTLHIHPIWMLDAVSGGPQPQPWFHNIILVHFGSIFLPHFSNITPTPPEQVLQCKGAPICPSTVYESAQTLHIPPIWMWDAAWDLLQPQP